MIDDQKIWKSKSKLNQRLVDNKKVERVEINEKWKTPKAFPNTKLMLSTEREGYGGQRID